MKTVDDKIKESMKPLIECPLCGNPPKTKVSFKGRTQHRNKRETQYCSCGWSKIIPTDREARVELGLID